MGVVFVEEIKGRYTFVLACCVVWCYVVLCAVYYGFINFYCFVGRSVVSSLIDLL